MKKTNKIFLSAMCFFLAGSMTVQAQQKQHEITFGGGGGISSLQYDLSTGEQKLGFGGNVGLGYMFFFHPQWGVGTGVEFALYNAKATINEAVSTSSENYAGKPYLLESTLTGFTEKQHANMLNVPLMVQFQTNTRHKFYAAIGAKLGFPMSANYSQTGTFSNVGIFPELRDPVTGDGGRVYPRDPAGRYTPIADAGIIEGTLNNKQDLDLKMAISGALQAGIKWQLNDAMALYTGVYFDYGFNDIYKDDRSTSIMTLNPTQADNLSKNSITGNSDWTDKLYPMALGVNVKLAFGLGKQIGNVPVSKEKEAVLALAETAKADREAAEKAAKDAAAQRAAAEEAAKEAAAQRAAAEKAVAEAKAKQVTSVIPTSDLSIYSEVIDNYNIGAAEPLTAEQKAKADKKIDLLKNDPKAKVILVGYTCNTGQPTSNVSLGLRRAEVVKEYMMKNGIAADRITTVTKGEADPVYPNDTEEHKRLNRRVEVIAYQQ